MKKKSFIGRYLFICFIFLAVCTIYMIRLVNLQITSLSLYSPSKDGISSREVTVQTVRGNIYDVNGKPLVTNLISHSIELDKGSLPTDNDALNATLDRLIAVLNENSVEIDTFMPIDGIYPNIQYNNGAISENEIKFKRVLKKYELEDNISCLDLYETLLEKYGILKDDGTYSYDGKKQNAVMTLRFSLDANRFDTDNPFTLADNADTELITKINESIGRGINIKTVTERIYQYPGYASHILGRVGKIQPEQVEYYSSLNYALDSTVGLEGAEKAFEEYLHGTDGIMVLEEDSLGNVINSYMKTEAIPGKDVYLTIDIDLQMVAEKALAANIEKIRNDAIAKGGENIGEKANSGALTIVSPKDGSVLALASYPSFDLSTYLDNYTELTKNEYKPLFNRALLGTYSPGSTFKIATSAAALTNGIINLNTIITDTGTYRYYNDYQPKCWYHAGHGPLNVTKAISVSCNYFFYETGRLLGIEKLNEYCSSLGMGEYTGIELSEEKGTVAGPAERLLTGDGVWNPGDTIQAAIGQSDNALTPIQLSSYISTVLNSGTRYQVHILNKVTNPATKEEKLHQPVVISTATLAPEHLTAIKEGMRGAIGITSSFKNYKFPIGIKTGTAQTSIVNNNALITAFAPFDNPEMVVSCVIEDGALGGNAGFAVRDIFSYYFSIDEKGNPVKENTEQQSDTEQTDTTQTSE